MAPLCSICSSTTNMPSWGISRAIPLRPLAPSARSCPAPRRKLNSSCVDGSPNRAHLANITTLVTHTHSVIFMHSNTTAAHTVTLPLNKWQHFTLVGKTEGLHLKGLLKEGIIQKELAKYTQTYNTAAPTADDRFVLCGLYSEQQLCGATFLWTSTCFDKATEDNFRQDDFTNFCENIYFFARSL